MTCDGRRVVEYRPGESFATEQSSTSGEGPGVLNCFWEPITRLGNGIWPLTRPGTLFEVNCTTYEAGSARVIGEETWQPSFRV